MQHHTILSGLVDGESIYPQSKVTQWELLEVNTPRFIALEQDSMSILMMPCIMHDKIPKFHMDMINLLQYRSHEMSNSK